MAIHLNETEIATIVELLRSHGKVGMLGGTTPAAAEMLEALQVKMQEGGNDNAYRRAAFNDHGDDECEIDDDAVVSVGDGGAFVMAWLWITDDEAGIDGEGNEGTGS